MNDRRAKGRDARLICDRGRESQETRMDVEKKRRNESKGIKFDINELD